MNVIPHELVEETWKEAGSYSRAQTIKLMNRIGKTQPDLLSFVHYLTKDLGADAHEMAVYLFMVICRIFDKSAGPIRRVGPKAIEEAYEANETFCERLIDTHERFLEKAVESVVSAQPFVMKYLVDALREAPESEDPVDLSEEDSGQVFLVLKTAIDLLDKRATPALQR